MVYVRQTIVSDASKALSRAVCIAVRYSCVCRQFGSQDGSSKTQVHALLSLLLHVCSFVIKNLRPGIQIAGSFKAAILILCCNTFHVAYSFCHVVYGLGSLL
ncbi:uncharacterized protein LOC121987441 [Zingiber officinale]|uniref:uncharacterized protein LOC121987441 n=1 Tax=Zingiber officinale TaxID=94328 RepID=UPI001C4BD12B|nr:uncharacterized protein LOC121987441 [Zingiber officinale]